MKFVSCMYMLLYYRISFHMATSRSISILIGWPESCLGPNLCSLYHLVFSETTSQPRDRDVFANCFKLHNKTVRFCDAMMLY